MHQIIHHWLLLSIFNSNDGNSTDQLHKQKFVGCRGLGILVGLELSRKLFLILWISLSCFKIQWGSNTHLFCSFNNFVTIDYALLLEVSFLVFYTSVSLLPTSLTIFLCQLSKCWSVSSILVLCFCVILSSIMTVNTFHLCLTPKYLFASPKLSLVSNF